MNLTTTIQGIKHRIDIKELVTALYRFLNDNIRSY
ncbi:MAG: hypothetical protein ACI9CQ_003287, partial [Saprospiraceae bacterium]